MERARLRGSVNFIFVSKEIDPCFYMYREILTEINIWTHVNAIYCVQILPFAISSDGLNFLVILVDLPFQHSFQILIMILKYLP